MKLVRPLNLKEFSSLKSGDTVLLQQRKSLDKRVFHGIVDKLGESKQVYVIAQVIGVYDNSKYNKPNTIGFEFFGSMVEPQSFHHSHPFTIVKVE